jgi:hypothetical protein
MPLPTTSAETVRVLTVPEAARELLEGACPSLDYWSGVWRAPPALAVAGSPTSHSTHQLR